MPENILVDAAGAADLLSLSERSFHDLRRREDFPADATIVLSQRAVRFRVEALHRYCAELAHKNVTQGEPEQLQRARQKRREIQAV
jgi:hypothetical protein